MRRLAIVLALLLSTVGGLTLTMESGDRVRCPTTQAGVVLDPGHGGDDPGAVNESAGLVERDLTLIIANRAAALLRTEGYRVALTRTDNATTLGNSERGRVANACRALAFVSIHLNSFGEPEPNYVRTLWATENPDVAFAATMQAAMLAELLPGADVEDGGLELFDSGALLAADMPGVLIEPVFLSNPDEAARLAGGDRLEQIARAVARGVDVWFRQGGVVPDQPPISVVDAFMQPSDPLLGPVRGSPEQVLAIAGSRGTARSREVEAFVREVYRLAPLTGLDPAIVIAQSALETGFWTSPLWRDHLNPAGIGITGDDSPSATWASGAEAARGQIVHLYLYAVGEIPADHPLAAYRSLDPRYDAALSANRAGVAKTVADLTDTWAADPNYASSIARVGNELFIETPTDAS